MPLLVSHCGSLGVLVVDVPSFGQAFAALVAEADGSVVCVVVAAGVDFLAFGLSNVLVGVVAGFRQFARLTFVSLGAGCVHCELSASFFELVGDVELVTAGLVCAKPVSGAVISAMAATPASNIGFLISSLPNTIGNKTHEGGVWCPSGNFSRAISRLRKR